MARFSFRSPRRAHVGRGEAPSRRRAAGLRTGSHWSVVPISSHVNLTHCSDRRALAVLATRSLRATPQGGTRGEGRREQGSLRPRRRPSTMWPVGNSLADALVRPCRVGVGAIAANRGAKMRLARDEHMVEALSAHAAEEDLADGVGVRLDPIAEHYCAKCRRTFAAIWRSVILSTVSTPAMRPPRSLLLRRFVSSPFASPGPNIRMDSASPMHAITAS